MWKWIGLLLSTLLWGCSGFIIGGELTIKMSAEDSLRVSVKQERAMEFPVPHSAWFSIGKTTHPVYTWSDQGVAYRFTSIDPVFLINRYQGEYYVVTFGDSEVHAFVHRQGQWRPVEAGLFPPEIALYNYGRPYENRPEYDSWFKWTQPGDGWQSSFLEWLRAARPVLSGDSAFCLDHLKERWKLLCPQEQDSLVRSEEYVSDTSGAQMDKERQESLCEQLGAVPAGGECALRLIESIGWRGKTLWLIENENYPSDVYVLQKEGETFKPLLHKAKHRVLHEYRGGNSRLFPAKQPDSSRLALYLVDWNAKCQRM